MGLTVQAEEYFMTTEDELAARGRIAAIAALLVVADHLLVARGAALDRETEEFWGRLGFAVVQGYALEIDRPRCRRRRSRVCDRGCISFWRGDTGTRSIAYSLLPGTVAALVECVRQCPSVTAVQTRLERVVRCS